MTTNAPRPDSIDVATWLDKLRQVIEALTPELRHYMKPELPGTVLKTYDDQTDLETYNTVDVRITAGGKDGSDLDLTNVPVDSVWANDGYGFWCIPEEGSLVNITFDNFDIKAPRVTGARYSGPEKAPMGLGFKAGACIFKGKYGQLLKFSSTSSEIVLSADSIKIISTAKRQGITAGDEILRVLGSRTTEMQGADATSADSWSISIARAASISVGSKDETVAGNATSTIGGTLTEKVAGSVSRMTAGGSNEATTFNKREVVGGGYEMLVAATPGIAPTPTPGTPTAAQNAAYKITVMLGGIAFDCLGGQIDIGTNPLTPPTFINIGAPTSGPVQLGGLAALGIPAVIGTQLVMFLSMLLTALQTPLQIGNLGAPTAPFPAFTAQIAALQSQLSTLLSTKVFVAPA